jgi:hypothetical protein
MGLSGDSACMDPLVSATVGLKVLIAAIAAV